MKLISWNVNGLRAFHKKGTFNSIFELDPDIFCLQETKAHPDQLPAEVKNPAGYQAYFDHSKLKKGYSGVAIYIKSKFKDQIVKVEDGMGKNELDQEGRFLALFLEDKTVIITCYFPNGGGGEDRLSFKMEYYKEFLNYIENLRKKDYLVIFCGDINTAHNEIDIARPKENENHTGFLRMERDWLDKIISLGWTDSFRHLHSQEIKYSWWDMKTFARDRNIGWRLDYFFISPNLLPRLKFAQILDNILGSDHCPVWLELK
ncbi:MAG: exodeoxyribonuclease III [Candidatus Taylorbacteria bacterium RIFOXYD2_FULL_36_9]|uniref:Exodeoxyribonuclease III n=1 Tax=Candidatus Taylorbacteria bacterium RIFOXYD2_FULL_36_9 TaxID=1802338 RepID=A0A1G2PEW0_9BACT|nr:MAG: exodeoxyribonuclease III [Candidatus Taylorbacteria bacterium RIFOXYD2_FULL_36_9]